MDKQSTLERMKQEREDPVKAGVPGLFGDHFRLSARSMTLEHAAAVAHEAVQRHLASVREAEEGEAM